MINSFFVNAFLFYFIFLLLGIISCSSAESSPQLNNDETGKKIVTPDYPFPYNLTKPDAIYELDRKLLEISGLSLSQDSSELVTVNDELGRVYYLEKSSGKLLSSFKFGSSGDYEGVEFVIDKYYVVKNNGTLIIIDSKTQNVKIENTFLTQANNVEGLSYWPKRNRLLLACKGSPSAKNKYKGAKAIYDFDLTEMKLKKKPMFLVSIKKIKDYFIGRNSPKIKKALSFAPSAIAVHPFSQHIYILSSHGNTLFIVDENGEILHIEFLAKSKFFQPEGITIDKDGTLYISNEGKYRKANIQKFTFIDKS